MSYTNRNFVAAYGLLVLLPLVGLAGVLKRGRHLPAPVAIDGTWTLQIDSGQLATLPCGKALASASDKALTISQSGRNFQIGFVGPASTGSGTLEGVSLHASVSPSVPWSSQNGCGAGRNLLLQATVDPKSRPKTLTGTLSADNCSACRPVEFRALRRNPPASNGGR
ncbi:MAG: hypothetical protein WCA16_01890 [Candidatus Sulfotelmatobacter sp.]